MTGGNVRMNVQLIHAATDRYVWAKDYERDAKHVMTLQAEVARDIATAIENRGAPRSSLPAPRTSGVSPEAYHLYLKGLAARGRVNYEGVRHRRFVLRGGHRQAARFREGSCEPGA